MTDEIHLGRRNWLRGAAALAMPWGAVGCTSKVAQIPANEANPMPFGHGIASGDPLPDGVILWTHITTDAPVDVTWEIAENATMTKSVQTGTFHTDDTRDFTVKVDVRGLQPGKTYYYRFAALGSQSRIGRTRTAPTGSPNELRFALVSCASLAHGYFHGYRVLAQRLDLDAIIHLGDYIYEYASGEYGTVRAYEPLNELLTLVDYRTRHAQYKRDPDLQECHRQQVFVVIWDDHETANDAYKDGAENHTPGGEGSFEDRKAAARQAYMEWMPIREQEDKAKIFRTLAFGDLADLILLDTRLYGRTKQVGKPVAPPPAPDPTRTLLGDEQAAWMEEKLRASKAAWKLIGQQVMVGHLILEKGKQLANLDQWQGYPESRNRFLTFCRDAGVKDIVVLTGDIHSSWANELVFDPNDLASYDPATGKGSVAVEFVTPAMTSPGVPPQLLPFVEQALPVNPHVRFVEPTHRGFVILDVNRERVQGAWYLFDDIKDPAVATPKFSAAWAVKRAETRLVAEPQPVPPSGGPAAAP